MSMDLMKTVSRRWHVLRIYALMAPQETLRTVVVLLIMKRRFLHMNVEVTGGIGMPVLALIQSNAEKVAQWAKISTLNTHANVYNKVRLMPFMNMGTMRIVFHRFSAPWICAQMAHQEAKETVVAQETTNFVSWMSALMVPREATKTVVAQENLFQKMN